MDGVEEFFFEAHGGSLMWLWDGSRFEMLQNTDVVNFECQPINILKLGIPKIYQKF